MGNKPSSTKVRQQQDNSSNSSVRKVHSVQEELGKYTEENTSTKGIKTLKDAAEESAAADVAVQHHKQTSAWSLGSLNWSFTRGASTQPHQHSFRRRSKSNTRRSLTKEQQQRSKTLWHKPITNAIFSSHFKESSRNDQFHIEHLIQKGAFGIVFQVTDKYALQNEHQQHQHQHQEPEQHNKQQDNKEHSGQTITTITTISATPTVYALKVLKKSKIIEDGCVHQIKDEVDIQKLCGHHPFIVKQIDLWQNRHNLHILSEYIPNGELFTKIAQFSVDLIRLYIAEIALAIDFLHNAGIIYRDAKPENILLTETYHIKLIDFGLSKWLKLGATTRTMCGTLQYMGTVC